MIVIVVGFDVSGFGCKLVMGEIGGVYWIELVKEGKFILILFELVDVVSVLLYINGVILSIGGDDDDVDVLFFMCC